MESAYAPTLRFVASWANACTLAVVVVSSGATRALYVEMLTAVMSKCDELHHSVDPSTVILEFEQGTISAVREAIGTHVRLQGCFYHLNQSTWRHIQQLGLVTAYRESDQVRHFCGMIDALAFLPLADVTEGIQYIRASIPNCNVSSELIALVAYFDQTYVSGTTRAIQRPPDDGSLRMRLRRTPPAFPPEIWNVHEETLADGDRTNNLCETWNKSFSVLVGHSHPSVLVTIEAF